MNFSEWFLTEQSSRYSIEHNYRTNLSEVLENYARLTLGYISAALKAHYHVKLVLNSKPLRIIVSTKNWDDGERDAIISFHELSKRFIFSKGFYNKGSRTVSLDAIHKTLEGNSASDLVKEILPMLHVLEKEEQKPPELKPLKHKTGPKQYRRF